MVSVAAAEVARFTRLVNIPVGLALAAVPLITSTSLIVDSVTVLAGLAIAALSFRRGAIKEQYGAWNKVIV